MEAQYPFLPSSTGIAPLRPPRHIDHGSLTVKESSFGALRLLLRIVEEKEVDA